MKNRDKVSNKEKEKLKVQSERKEDRRNKRKKHEKCGSEKAWKRGSGKKRLCS